MCGALLFMPETPLLTLEDPLLTLEAPEPLLSALLPASPLSPVGQRSEKLPLLQLLQTLSVVVVVGADVVVKLLLPLVLFVTQLTVKSGVGLLRVPLAPGS